MARAQAGNKKMGRRRSGSSVGGQDEGAVVSEAARTQAAAQPQKPKKSKREEATAIASVLTRRRAALTTDKPEKKKSAPAKAHGGTSDNKLQKSKKLAHAKRKSKSLVKNTTSDPCTSSGRGASSRSKAEPQSGNENAEDGRPETENGKSKHRRRRKRKTNYVPQDAVSRLKKRVKYFFIRMNMEQNLIDAYSNEGWKGQSREKVRPESELQRAKAQILKCKLKIRESMQELDALSLEGSIMDSAFDDDGQLDYQEIFCAKCHSHEAEIDNDIVLCDGACNRGFHQQCLNPPLATEDIPPGDEGWLCPACECKADCVSLLNDHLGTVFEVETTWEDFFPEAVAGSGTDGDATQDLPSDESDDDDYDPESQDPKKQTDANGQVEQEQSCSGDSSDGHNSEDDGSDSDEDSEGDSMEDLLAEGISEGEDEGQAVDDSSQGKAKGKKSTEAQADGLSSDADETDDRVPASGKRRRNEVDYRKLHDEMFGKEQDLENGQQSEDEDWGPMKRQRKEGGVSNYKGKADVATEEQNDAKSKRLPMEAVERLRGSFAENQLPSRSHKEDLSRELGLSYRKVDIWFKNIRYQALKKGLAQPTRPCPWKYSKMNEGGSKLKLKTKRDAVENSGLLLQQLGEAQFKLHDLRRTLEAMQQPEVFKLFPHVRSFENMVIDARRGKRVIYMPVAEVVEKVREVTAAHQKLQ